MASTPRRRRSRDLPPKFSVLEKKLRRARIKFIRQFGTKESRMREIVRELRKISKEVKRVQEMTDKDRETGAVAGGVGLVAGLGLGLIAAPFTGGASLAVVVAGGGAIGASFGGGVVIAANVDKMCKEKDCATAVKTLGEEFQQIVEPLKRTLEEMKETCEKLEEEAAEYQSGNTLTNIEEYEDILRRVTGLKMQSLEALLVATLSTQMTDSLLTLIVKVFRLTPTPAEDKQLRDAIIQSAYQSQKVVDEFEKMETLLKEVIKDFWETFHLEGWSFNN